MPSHARADCLDVARADVEVHPDRLQLEDVGEFGRGIGADEFANRNEPLGDGAVEGRRDLRIAVIDPGLLKVCLVLFDRRLPCSANWRSNSASDCTSCAFEPSKAAFAWSTFSL
jgi:hypothetical protein